MKNFNLIEWLWKTDSHEKQTPQRFARYAAVLIMLLTLGVGQMWAGTKRVYCKVANSDWQAASAKVNVHYWGGSSAGTTWPGAKMTASGTANVYYADIPDDVTSFKFARVNSTQTEYWGHQTDNLSFPASPASGLNLYEITGRGEPSDGQWANIGFESTGGNSIKYYYSGNANDQTWDISSVSGASATKDLGTITSLYLKGWNMKMYQNMDAAIVDGTTNRWLYYNIHRSAVSPGVYSSKTLDEWNWPGWDGGYRKPYGSKSCNENLLEGLGSGKYSMTFYLQHNGLINFYLNNGGSNYNLKWTIGVPAMATHVVTSDGTGTGASATPFNMAVGSTLTISVSGTQASSDANSVLYVSFDNGSTYSATTTKSISITNTTKYSVHIKAKYYNSADDLSGTVYDFGDVYYQGTQTPSLAISSFTQNASTVTAANSGSTVTINASRQNAGSATITYAYSTDNSNWTTIASTTSTTQSWTLPAVTSTTTYYVKASMTYESTEYSDTENFKVYGKKTIKVKNTNGWSPFYMHRWGGDRAGTSFPGDDDQISDYGSGQWKQVVLYSSNNNFIFVDGTNTDNKNSDQTYAGVSDGGCYEIASGTGVVALNSTANCPAKPSLTTTSTPSANNYTTATIAGNISSNGNDNITDYGFYWGTSATPGTKVQKGTSNYTGGISHALTSLTPGTTYYYRAYAVNGQGETLGTVYSFKSPYKVTIDKSTGCSSISPSGTQYTSGSINLTADAATGYTFSAWSKTNGDLSNAATPSAGRNTVTFTPTSDNATITATYTENSYNVTLASTSGGYTTPTEGTVSVKQVTGTSISATPNTNFVFTGWTHTGGGITKTSSATTTPNTFKATTTGGTITANFADEWNVKGGDNTEDVDDALGDWDTYNGMPYAGVSNTFSKSFSLPAKTTYHFKVVKRGNAGAADVWYGVDGGKTLTRGSNSVTGLEQNGGEEEYITFTTDAAGDYTIKYLYNAAVGSMKITVEYPEAYTVTYGAGTINGSNSAISVSPSFTSGDYVLPSTAVTFSKGSTKAGYTWKGWYSNTAGTGEAWSTTDANWTSAASTRSSNISVYACYNFVTYNIAYNLNGGSGASDRTYNVETSTITLPTAPTVNRTGYTFGGWYDNSSFTGSAITQIAKGSTGNKEFWAKWTPKTYTITLNQNGATTSSDPTSLTATYDGKANGASDQFTLTNPEKTGYTFAGWYENEGGSGAEIITTAQYYKWEDNPYVTTTGLWQHDGNVTVYAKWEPNDYTVTLSTTGETGYGSGAPDNQTATYDAAMPTITPPVGAPGYKFQGYFTGANGTGTKYYNANGTSAHTWDIAEATTLHAYFLEATITSLEHETSVAKAEKAELVVNPVLNVVPENYIAICWTLHYADNDNPVDGEHWSVTSYTEGGTKPNQVKFTFTNLANGNYYVKATLRKSASAFSNICTDGTRMMDIHGDFHVVGNNTVTVRYMTTDLSSDFVLKAPTEVEVEAMRTAEVTAPKIPGYTFTRWSIGDGISKESGEYTSATITISATYDGVITARYAKKKMVYFNNTVGWDTVFVYFYNGAEGNKYWDNTVGTGANKEKTFNGNKPFYQKYYGGMKRVAPGSNIWYFDYLAAGFSEGDISSNISFAAKDQAIDKSGATDAEAFFSNTEAIFRDDFDPVNLPMYVPLTSPTETRNNTTKYYDQGYWMNYPESTGYELRFYNKQTSDGSGEPYELIAKRHKFEFTGDKTLPMSVSLDLEAGHDYFFKIYRVDDTYYGNNGQMTNGHSGDEGQPAWEFKTGTENAWVTASGAGNYTFTLTYGIDLSSNYNYLVGVRYPESTGDFRVLYSDAVRVTNHDSNEGKSWLASYVIPKTTESDTVSFFVRTASSPKIKAQKCTATYENDVTTVTWTDENGGADLLPDTIYADGVYNFIFTKSGDNLVLSAVEPYTGNFYIRVDGAGSSNWDNFRAADHLMPYSDYSFKQEDEPYSHYFTQWYEPNPENKPVDPKNIKFVVANDYSACVSDTIIRDGIADNYVDANGWLSGRNANIRFMYNYKTNAASRRYIDGAQESGSEFLLLIPEGNDMIFDAETDGDAYSQVTFSDKGNWLYEANVWVVPGTTYKLKSNFGVAPNLVEQYFKGAANGDGEFETLVGGSGSSRLQIRLLYDFKTNRIVSAYVPSSTLSSDLAINADVMFIREGQGEMQQLTFENDATLSAIKNVYSVLRFNKWTLNNRYTTGGHGLVADPKSIYERSLYFVSFPFDVKLSDVFGFGTYWDEWYIEYYDGAARAKNGFWIDSDSYWKYVTPAMKDTFTLKAGQGYIFGLDLDYLHCEGEGEGQQANVWKNIQTADFIFPGNVSSISNSSVTYTLPDHTCTINRGTASGNRTIADSHWNVLGVPTYLNTNSVSFEKTTGDWMTDGKPKYIYSWNPQDNSLTPTSAAGFTYHSMNAYVVQYYGNVTFSTSVSAAAAPRRNPEYRGEYEFRLEIQKNDEALDQTYVRLSDDEEVTANFEFGYDLTKAQTGRAANLYTIIEGYLEAAGNTLPLTNQTTIVPVGVKVNAAGDFTFSMPDGTEGIGVTLVDTETGIRTSLSALEYTVNLEAGTYDNRFYLEISPIVQNPTDIENVQGDNVQGTKVRKVMVDGILYIVKDGKMFDAQGRQVK